MSQTQQWTDREATTPGDGTQPVTVAGVRFEHLDEAVGIGTSQPRLSWIVTSAPDGWQQTAYELESLGPDGSPSEQTGRVESGESVLLAWPFAALESRERRIVRVRVWGDQAEPSAWSPPATVEAGLLDSADWSARFITPDWDEHGTERPGSLLRRTFEVRSGVARARLYITALGVYEAQLNGAPVGDHVLAPGWTSYNYRLRYQTFDVTALLHEGANALGAMLADGWYRGRLGFGGGFHNIYGDRTALLAQLEIGYADGSIERVVSDESWRSAQGPVLASNIYDGETYDARREQDGWASAELDDSDWSGVRIVQHDLGTLFAPSGPPVRRTELLAPVSIATSPSGRTIVDFGQNLVGRVRFTVSGEAGQTITLRHAEVLQDGELCVRPLRHAKATDSYTLRGGGAETWEPRFTFHGFRYAEVSGWPGELTAGDLRAVVCHSDMRRTGWFECSDRLVNQLHTNIVWSMRGNFLDVPTDCPQRDERLGWTGDIQVFAPTASFLYDCAGFLQSWLADLAVEQQAKGVVPFFVPELTLDRPNPPAAAWGDAAVIVPWVLYQRFGDTGILAQQFPSMRAWVDLLAEVAGPSRLWGTGFQFGDWLDPAAPPDRPGDARTDHAVVATAYFAHSAELVGRAAGVLGRAEDEAYYLRLASEVRAAFNGEYVTRNGRVISDSTTAYGMALEFALLPDQAQRWRAGERLAELVRAGRYRISTGFVGTPLVCDALCNAGREDAAFRLLMQRECPSWLYPVTMGATTIWERWDSLLPDGTVNPGEMTSFNHYALGAVGDWLHRVVGGLAPAEPGYRRLELRPRPGGGITSARARHETPYGIAECAWSIADGRMELQAIVPPNTSALVTLPGREDAPESVGSGTHRWSYAYNPRRAERPALTLDSTINEVVDDVDAYDAVLATLKQHAPRLARHLQGGTPQQGKMTLHQILEWGPKDSGLAMQLEAALAAAAQPSN